MQKNVHNLLLKKKILCMGKGKVDHADFLIEHLMPVNFFFLIKEDLPSKKLALCGYLTLNFAVEKLIYLD